MTLPRRALRLAVTLGKVGVTVGAVWLILRSAPLAEIGDLLLRASPVWLVLGAVATLLQLLAGAWRWQLVHHLLGGARVAFGPMFRGFCRGMLFGQLLPSSIGSDAIRAVDLARGSSLTSAVRSVVCDRLLGLAALLLIVTLTLPLFAALIDHDTAFAALAAASVTGLGAIVLIMVGATWVGRLPVIGGLAPYIGGDLRQTLLSPEGRLPVLLAVLSHALSIAMFAAMARATGGTTPLLLLALIVLPAMLVASVPVSLGGWGVREAVIASAYGMTGGLPAAGVSASIIFGLSTPLLCAVVELGCALLGRGAARRDKAAPGAA